MTSPSLGRLLISHITLRGADLEAIYALIQAHEGIEYPALRAHVTPLNTGSDDFGLQESALLETLNFLLGAELIEQRGASRRKAAFHVTPPLVGQPFVLQLLQRLTTHHDQRQRGLSLVHRQLVTNDVLVAPFASLRNQMERSPYANLFVWTHEKLAFWSHLASFAGLVRRIERESCVLLAPQVRLAKDALTWALGSVEQEGCLAEALEAIDQNLFACFTSRGRVHCGLTQTLVALHRLEYIRLLHRSDAARSVLLGDWRVSDVTVLL